MADIVALIDARVEPLKRAATCRKRGATAEISDEIIYQRKHRAHTLTDRHAEGRDRAARNHLRRDPALQPWQADRRLWRPGRPDGGRATRPSALDRSTGGFDRLRGTWRRGFCCCPTRLRRPPNLVSERSGIRAMSDNNHQRPQMPADLTDDDRATIAALLRDAIAADRQSDHARADGQTSNAARSTIVGSSLRDHPERTRLGEEICPAGRARSAVGCGNALEDAGMPWVVLRFALILVALSALPAPHALAQDKPWRIGFLLGHAASPGQTRRPHSVSAGAREAGLPGRAQLCNRGPICRRGCEPASGAGERVGRAQSGRHRDDRNTSSPRRQRSDYHCPNCHGRGQQPGREWSNRQPGASWRKRDGSCP